LCFVIFFRRFLTTLPIRYNLRLIIYEEKGFDLDSGSITHCSETVSTKFQGNMSMYIFKGMIGCEFSKNVIFHYEFT